MNNPKSPNHFKGRVAILKQAQARREALRPVVLELRRQGLTLDAIAVTLQERSLSPPRGGRWHRNTVARLLKPATFKYVDSGKMPV